MNTQLDRAVARLLVLHFEINFLLLVHWVKQAVYFTRTQLLLLDNGRWAGAPVGTQSNVTGALFQRWRKMAVAGVGIGRSGYFIKREVDRSADCTLRLALLWLVL